MFDKRVSPSLAIVLVLLRWLLNSLWLFHVYEYWKWNVHTELGREMRLHGTAFNAMWNDVRFWLKNGQIYPLFVFMCLYGRLIMRHRWCYLSGGLHWLQSITINLSRAGCCLSQTSYGRLHSWNMLSSASFSCCYCIRLIEQEMAMSWSHIGYRWVWSRVAPALLLLDDIERPWGFHVVQFPSVNAAHALVTYLRVSEIDWHLVPSLLPPLLPQCEWKRTTMGNRRDVELIVKRRLIESE